jgi:DNA-binding MurR/RpiR family transcriptional regulator
MNSASPLFKQLKDRFDGLSKTQRVLAKYITGNYQTVAFSTIAQLAHLSGASEASIVRFTKALGFEGYPAFQKEIRRLVRADLKGTERFRLTNGHAGPSDSPLKIVIEKELENIADLESAYDPKAFTRAVAAVAHAPEVLIVGARNTASLANHLWFGLHKIGIKAVRSLAVTTETYDQVNALGLGSWLVVIGFPRYLQEEVDLLKFCRARKLGTIAITDSAFSPLQGDVSLYAPAESAHFTGFHCAPLILINALLHQVSLADKTKTIEALKRFEILAEDRAYFHRT